MAALTRIATKIGIPSTAFLFVSCRGIATKLFVGGLSFYTTDKGLTEAFSQYGQVVEGPVRVGGWSKLWATIVHDRVSDRSKGFGFITFASEDEAHTALTEMNGKQLNGRVVYVDYAKPRTSYVREMPIARGPPEPSERTESSHSQADLS